MHCLHEGLLVVGHVFLRQRQRFTVTVLDELAGAGAGAEFDPPNIFFNRNGIGSANAFASAYASGLPTAYTEIH